MAEVQENIEFQTAAISDVTVHLRDSGTDSATDRYMALGRHATSVVLRSDQILTIEEINGKRQKQPLTVNANKPLTVTATSGFKIFKLKLNVLTASTNIKIFATTTTGGGA